MKQPRIPVAYRIKREARLGIERLSDKLLMSHTRLLEFMVDYFDKCDNEQLNRAILEGRLASLTAAKERTEKEIEKLEKTL